MGALLPNTFKELLYMFNNGYPVSNQNSIPVQNLTQEQVRHKNILQDLTIEQKAHIYDVLIEQLVKEGSYSILACGHITSKVITSVIDLKAEGKL